jgi:hydrogenase nickel incorporation protein HypA/HybF
VHEVSVAAALLRRVEERARKEGATAVGRVHVRVGELAGVVPELLLSAWERVREGGLCTGAPLELERVPVRWECPRCGADLPAGAELACAGCGEPARLAGGDELLLSRIELEVA